VENAIMSIVIAISDIRLLLTHCHKPDKDTMKEWFTIQAKFTMSNNSPTNMSSNNGNGNDGDQVEGQQEQGRQEQGHHEQGQREQGQREQGQREQGQWDPETPNPNSLEEARAIQPTVGIDETPIASNRVGVQHASMASIPVAAQNPPQGSITAAATLSEDAGRTSVDQPANQNVVNYEDLKSVESHGALLKFSMDIQEAIYDGDPLDVDSSANKRLYCSDNGFSVTRNSIRRLKPGTYLNDDLIGYYFGCLNAREYERAEREGGKMKILFFDPQFFLMFSGDSMFDLHVDDVLRWLQKYKRRYKVDIFEVDKIVFAINHPTMQHHFGVLVNNQKMLVSFLDSLYLATKNFHYIVLGKMLDFLGTVYHWLRDGPGVVYDRDTDPHPERTFPQQGNGDDCGIFLCMGADCLGMGIGYEFNQTIMERC
jgi:hypothetical protein